MIPGPAVAAAVVPVGCMAFSAAQEAADLSLLVGPILSQLRRFPDKVITTPRQNK